uniref:Uncharacterized protein n=1 Tax=Anopheles melas TaxID=34690 RepID=A0A182UIE4_9DIPT
CWQQYWYCWRALKLRLSWRLRKLLSIIRLPSNQMLSSKLAKFLSHPPAPAPVAVAPPPWCAASAPLPAPLPPNGSPLPPPPPEEAKKSSSSKGSIVARIGIAGTGTGMSFVMLLRPMVATGRRRIVCVMGALLFIGEIARKAVRLRHVTSSPCATGTAATSAASRRRVKIALEPIATDRRPNRIRVLLKLKVERRTAGWRNAVLLLGGAFRWRYTAIATAAAATATTATLEVQIPAIAFLHAAKRLLFVLVPGHLLRFLCNQCIVQAAPLLARCGRFAIVRTAHAGRHRSPRGHPPAGPIIRRTLVQRVVQQRQLTGRHLILIVLVVIVVYARANPATLRCVEIEVILLRSHRVPHRGVVRAHLHLLPVGARSALLAKPPILLAVRTGQAGATDHGAHSSAASSTRFVVASLFLLLRRAGRSLPRHGGSGTDTTTALRHTPHIIIQHHHHLLLLLLLRTAAAATAAYVLTRAMQTITTGITQPTAGPATATHHATDQIPLRVLVQLLVQPRTARIAHAAPQRPALVQRQVPVPLAILRPTIQAAVDVPAPEAALPLPTIVRFVALPVEAFALALVKVFPGGARIPARPLVHHALVVIGPPSATVPAIAPVRVVVIPTAAATARRLPLAVPLPYSRRSYAGGKLFGSRFSYGGPYVLRSYAFRSNEREPRSPRSPGGPRTSSSSVGEDQVGPAWWSWYQCSSSKLSRLREPTPLFMRRRCWPRSFTSSSS